MVGPYRTTQEILEAWKAGKFATEQQVADALANFFSAQGQGMSIQDAIASAKQVLNANRAQYAPQGQGDAYVPDPGWGEEEPFAAYLKQYNLPGMGQTSTQRWQSRQYDPQRALYQAREYLSPEGTTPVEWPTYMAGQPAGSAAHRQQSMDIFRKQVGATPQEQREFKEVGLGESFDDFLGNVLRGRYPAEIAGRMAQRLPGMQEEWESKTMGDPTASFMDWLQKRLRI